MYNKVGVAGISEWEFYSVIPKTWFLEGKKNEKKPIFEIFSKNC